jgi:N6-adenosine-specific RNA methylase IME4
MATDRRSKHAWFVVDLRVGDTKIPLQMAVRDDEHVLVTMDGNDTLVHVDELEDLIRFMTTVRDVARQPPEGL